MNRRKVLIYLRPETHTSERFADARIEAFRRCDRGELSRTALLAGITLGEIDSRLPSVLTSIAGRQHELGNTTHYAGLVSEHPVGIASAFIGNSHSTNTRGNGTAHQQCFGKEPGGFSAGIIKTTYYIITLEVVKKQDAQLLLLCVLLLFPD